ncbi:MAG: dihydrodipicolinate synthase family protein [Acetobacteraceae bacterium]
MTDFHGIYPILYAFFDRDGRLDRSAMRAQVEACVKGGAHGIAILGLATETHKLQTTERRQVLDWVAEDLNGRLPLAVTIAEPSVAGQVEFARSAKSVGADWVILQPPAATGLAEIEYVRFFGAVADKSELPVAIQNAAGLIAVALSNAGLISLNRNHPNVSLLKGEGPVIGIQRLIEETQGVFRIFNGRAGLELTDNLRAGCVGMIPAPECFDVQVRIYEAMRAGREDEAEELYRRILPLITLLMSSVENFLCYGRRIVARRLGIAEGHPRQPSQAPTPFGLAAVERASAFLGPYGT